MVLNDAFAEECRKYGFQVVRRFKIGTYKQSLQARKAQYGAFDEDIQASCNSELIFQRGILKHKLIIIVVKQVRAERALRRGA